MRELPSLGRLALFLLLVLLIVWGILTSIPTPANLEDLGTFIASGQAVNQGLNPYAVYTQLPDHPRHASNYVNVNPPLLLPAFQLLALFDPTIIEYAWLLVSIAPYVLALYLLRRAYPEQFTPLLLAWGLALVPFWYTVSIGQIYTLLALGVVIAWLLLRENRTIAAGLLIGLLVAIKPHLAVWPALLLLSGHFAIALAALGTVVLFSFIPLALYGPTVYAQWFALLQSDAGQMVYLNLGSLIGVATQFGVRPIGMICSAALLLILAIWAFHFRPAPLEASRLALVAAFLASPLSWPGYALLLLPLFFERPWSFSYRLAATTFIIPIPFGFAYTIVLLVMLGALISQRSALPLPGTTAS